MNRPLTNASDTILLCLQGMKLVHSHWKMGSFKACVLIYLSLRAYYLLGALAKRAN